MPILLAVNQNTNSLIEGFNNPNPIQGPAGANSIGVKLSDTPVLGFTFGVPYGLALEINLVDAITNFVFGAKLHDDFYGDYLVSNLGATFGDGVLNSTATLTSATAAFTGADVGRSVTGTGIPAATTILTVNSATNVTLSAAATATAAGVNITIGRPTWTKTGGSTFADAVTNTTTTLTSATAGFTPSDAGLAISGTNIPANTTILSVQSPTSITLSAAATGSSGAGTIVIAPNPLTGAARTPTYSVTPSFKTLELVEALVNGPIAATYASATARYAAVGLTNGQIVFQSNNGTFWVVIDQANLGDAAGWSFDVPGLPSIALDAELTVQMAGSSESTLTFTILVYNNINKGFEGVPIEANPDYPPPASIVQFGAGGVVNLSAVFRFNPAIGVYGGIEYYDGAAWHTILTTP